MKRGAFTIIEILIVFFAIVIIAAVIIPLNMSDASQGQRVAKWHKVYDELVYSFNLLKVHKGSILGDNPENMTNGEYMERISPFLNVADNNKQTGFEKYKYRYRNKTYVKKNSRYYFNDFFMLKNNVLVSLKKNKDRLTDRTQPYVYMFVDVNGIEKPNRIGLDIFFINIYNDKITPFGDGYPLSKLKSGCSEIGKGLFCSKYYLVGSNL